MLWLDALLERLVAWLRRRLCPPCPDPLEMDDLALHVWCQKQIRRIEAKADQGEERWQ